MTRTVSILLYLAIMAAFAFARHATQGQASFWFDEDGIVENIGAVAFLIASIAFLVAARRIGLERGARRAVVAYGLAAIMFLAFGEEISWGQRIFGWETPEALMSLNAQAETNLHNLKWFHVDENSMLIDRLSNFNTLFALFCLGFGIVLPLGYLKLSWVRRLADGFGVPVASLWIGLAFAVTYVSFSVAISGQPRRLAADMNELKESAYAVIMAVIAVSVVLRQRACEKRE